MTKAYWVVQYREIRRPEALAEYAKFAGPAVHAGGGRFLVRGSPSVVYEAGLKERTVVVEFPSLEAAIATHDGPGYQEALRVLGDAVVRDMRLVDGLG